MTLYLAALAILFAVVFVACAVVAVSIIVSRYRTPKPLDDADPERIWTGDLEP